MKKIIALLLALVLTFGLVACGGTEDVRGNIDSGNNTATENKSQNATEGSKEKDFSTGKVTTNKYTNEFLGITVELGSDWTFMTDAQIEENNKTALGLVGDDYKALMENASSFTDMMATKSNQTDTVNVTFEKLTGANLLLTEDRYAELSLDTLKGSFESMGMTDVVVANGKDTFAGAEHACITLSAKYNGNAVYEKLIVVKCSGYMVTVCACTWQTDTCKSILDNFKAL